MSTSAQSITAMDLQGIVRNVWGRWDFKAIPQMMAVSDPAEFKIRWMSGPRRDQQAASAGAYVQSQIAVKPGSFICGFSHFAVDERFDFQFTDLSLGREMFNMPISNLNLGSTMHYLSELYPVVAPGLFRLEFWNTRTSGGVLIAGRVQMIVVIAEKVDHE